MQNVILEEKDPGRADEMQQFFARHLVKLLLQPPGGHERNAAAYAATDAVILSYRGELKEMAAYINRLSAALACPVVVMCLTVASESEEVELLEAGAADCLSPPFGLRELLARLRAKARRLSIARQRTRRPNYRFGAFGLDCDAGEILTTTASAKLTPKEFSLLEHLLRNSRAGITREELLDVVSADNLDVNDRSIDGIVSRLRERLVALGGSAELIRTIRGFGYMLDSPADAISADDDLRALLEVIPVANIG